MNSYESQWEFESALMNIFGIEDSKIHSINLKMVANKIPILVIERIPDESEKEQLVNLLESYEIALTKKEKP